MKTNCLVARQCAVVLAAATLLILTASTVQSATVIYYSGFTSGTGQQFASAPSTPISGTMAASVPRFNPGLGTLTQADFDFAASITGTMYADNNPGGTSTFNLSGPADVDGESMGGLTVGFSGPYFPNPAPPSNDFDASNAFLSLTSGPFFASLSGPGSVTLSWLYSGSTTLSTPAIGAGPGGEMFSWGGSAHVMYTYEPIPEPATITLAAIAALALFAVAQRYAVRFRALRPSP